MTFDEYQKQSAKTLLPEADQRLLLARLALGLSGESGEVADKVKKILRDNDGVLNYEKKQEISKELGDVLWYLARLADLCDVKLDTIAWNNLEKLFSRQSRGKLQGSGDNR